MSFRILIVDDHAEIRKLLRVTLEVGNFEVHEAESGKGALAMVARVKPRIVLMDIMMPGAIDGLQACRLIKDNPDLAGIKVVMLTARGQQIDIDQGKVAGADHYLVKPFSPLQLIDMVNELVGEPRL